MPLNYNNKITISEIYITLIIIIQYNTLHDILTSMLCQIANDAQYVTYNLFNVDIVMMGVYNVDYI